MESHAFRDLGVRKFWQEGIYSMLCEQTRELTDDLHDFLDYV